MKIFKKIKNSTITHVANEESLTYDQVKGILESKFEVKKTELMREESV